MPILRQPALFVTFACACAGALAAAFAERAHARQAEAASAVYRCPTTEGTTLYQAAPCALGGQSVDLHTHQPSLAEAIQAQRISRREQVFVAQIEAEREKKKREADVERAKATAAQAERDARCDKYLENARRADQAESHKSGRHANNEARALRNRHFSECFAR